MTDPRFIERQDSIASPMAQRAEYLHRLGEKIETSYRAVDYLFRYASTVDEFLELANLPSTIKSMERRFKRIAGRPYIKIRDRPLVDFI